MIVNKKIALNGRFSGTLKPTGTQIVAYHLYKGIISSDRDFGVVLYCDTRFKDIGEWTRYPNVEICHVPFLDWSRTKAQLWEQIVFPYRARSAGCNLLHSPITTSPFFSQGVKSTVTFHDFNFKLHPEWFSRQFVKFLEFAGIKAARRASRVVVISDYVKNHALKYLGVSEAKISKVYNGLNPIVAQSSRFSELNDDYILCVGSLQPHKNLLRTIYAFQAIQKKSPNLLLKIVGRPQGNFSLIPGLEDALKSDGIELLGYLSDEDLSSAYSNAALFCYPSLEEGFGLPILEAMACGTPVVTSNLSCLPEIAGGAAILCDPFSVDSIAGAMELGLGLDPDARNELISRGRARCADFSWALSAKRYVEIFEEELG